MTKTQRQLISWGLLMTAGDIMQDLEIRGELHPFIGIDWHGFGDHLMKHADIDFLSGPASGSTKFYDELFRQYGAYLIRQEGWNRESDIIYPQYVERNPYLYRIPEGATELSAEEVRAILTKTRQEHWEKKTGKKIADMVPVERDPDAKTYSSEELIAHLKEMRLEKKEVQVFGEEDLIDEEDS